MYIGENEMLEDKKLIQTIRLRNFLSFGPTSEEIELKALNVLIGPNGSGKSNLIEAISFLRATPKDLTSPIRDGGGGIDGRGKGICRRGRRQEGPENQMSRRLP
jgi:predicted ATPase